MFSFLPFPWTTISRSRSWLTNTVPGLVTTAVRVRPPLNPSDPGYELIPQRFQRSMVHVSSPTNLTIDAPQGRKLFVFDRVFSESIDQEGIWEYLHESVSSFVTGYNVSLLAYGQSGAGKSYTMGTSGPQEQNNPKVMGKLPNLFCLVFTFSFFLSCVFAWETRQPKAN